MATYKATIFGETYELSADFSQASDPIMQEVSDPCERGDYPQWESTRWQVADFGHYPEDAMRAYLSDVVAASGDDPEEYEDAIGTAVAEMEVN